MYKSQASDIEKEETRKFEKGKASYEIGDIVREQLALIWGSTTLTLHQKRIFQAIADCRTAALGGHVLACTDCGQVQVAYNSCRNRNCPKCQSGDREKWIASREKELLPVPYFHLVFTLPHELNSLSLRYPKVIYNCLFQSAWYTVNCLGKDEKWLGAQTGMTAVLHTWGSNISLHPHVHCIVPGGGLTADGQWKTARSNGNYLFNRQVMGLIFRARFVKLLRQEIAQKKIEQSDIPRGLFKRLFSKEWITYAKRPFVGTKSVVEYLGRYTHKIAITNHRITKVTASHVYFRYKNYRKGGGQEELSLRKWDFIQRLALHIVPHKFVRIRHYGLLSNRNKKSSLAKARAALNCRVNQNAEKAVVQVLEVNQQLAWCTCCKKLTVQQIIDVLPPIRGSPKKPSEKG